MERAKREMTRDEIVAINRELQKHNEEMEKEIQSLHVIINALNKNLELRASIINGYININRQLLDLTERMNGHD